MYVAKPKSSAFTKASKNLVGDVEAPFLWRQPTPAAYNVPYNVPQNAPQWQSRQFTLNHAEGPGRHPPQNSRMVSAFHPPRNVSRQPSHTIANPHLRGHSIPQGGVRASSNWPNSHEVRLTGAYEGQYTRVGDRSKETKVNTSYKEWRPEELPNGNYK